VTRPIRIVGAGLAGATVAYLLARAGVAVEVLEAESDWGGQLRTAEVGGVLYEPTGAHIFHTADVEVWRLVTGLVDMRAYRHRVRTEVFGTVLSWPPQLPELRKLSLWPEIERQLAARPERPCPDNLETWCIGLMGETLYREFIAGYTRKQWGREPAELASAWAPRRIELREDGDPYLFRDPYQGWPVGGYRRLIDTLLAGVPVTMGQRMLATDWEQLCQGARAVVLTCALDEFFDESIGPLAWRGVRLVNRYLPGRDHELPCGVLNVPSAAVPYTRMIETKWMSGQTGPGTVVSYEYPGAPARHYPVEDAEGVNRDRQRAYERLVTQLPGPPRVLAGRLATYSYIDMDQAIRQGINAARRLLRDP
jgi:UDP-galactopyranose mutase